METLNVEKYVLVSVENILRLCANHFNSYERKTCLDRDIIANLNCIRKILNGEELNGKERIETLTQLKHN